MVKRKKTNFRDAVQDNIRRRDESKKSFGYFNLPKGIKTLDLEKDTIRCRLDFVTYIVTDVKHPDRNEEKGYAVEGTEWWKRPFKVHRNVGANNESVVCPTSIGEKCPICEHRLKLIKQGADKEVWKLLYPKERTLYIVVPIGVAKHDEVPYLWDMSDRLCQDTIKEALKEDPDSAVFPSIDEGLTAVCRIKWKTLGENTYPEITDIKFEEREPYDEKILESVPNLDKVLRVLPYKEIEAKFLEIEEEEDGGTITEADDNTKEEPPKTFHRRAKVEPVVEEEEEEEEKPPVVATRATRRTAKADTAEKCPHGHKYGVDTEEFKECDTCELYDPCLDEKEK